MQFYESFEYVIKSENPLYVFEFTYVGNLNESGLWSKNLPGIYRPTQFSNSSNRSLRITIVFIAGYAGHGDENNYVSLCRGFFPNPQTNDADKEMIKTMCTFYTNFAKTG